MAKIVDFDTYREEMAQELIDCQINDLFLIEEGLELLADYRNIADKETRFLLRALIKSLTRKPLL